jgi:hypothetical protein
MILAHDPRELFCVTLPALDLQGIF